MWEVAVDSGKCVGCGACVDVCPEVFEIRYEKAWVVNSGKGKNCDYTAAVRICPEGAIIIA